MRDPKNKAAKDKKKSANDCENCNDKDTKTAAAGGQDTASGKTTTDAQTPGENAPLKKVVAADSSQIKALNARVDRIEKAAIQAGFTVAAKNAGLSPGVIHAAEQSGEQSQFMAHYLHGEKEGRKFCHSKAPKAAEETDDLAEATLDSAVELIDTSGEETVSAKNVLKDAFIHGFKDAAAVCGYKMDQYLY